MIQAVAPILVLRARAEARALLYGFGEFDDLDQAIYQLRVYARNAGILDLLGREAVEHIITDPFKRFAA